MVPPSSPPRLQIDLAGRVVWSFEGAKHIPYVPGQWSTRGPRPGHGRLFRTATRYTRDQAIYFARQRLNPRDKIFDLFLGKGFREPPPWILSYFVYFGAGGCLFRMHYIPLIGNNFPP